VIARFGRSRRQCRERRYWVLISILEGAAAGADAGVQRAGPAPRHGCGPPRRSATAASDALCCGAHARSLATASKYRRRKSMTKRVSTRSYSPQPRRRRTAPGSNRSSAPDRCDGSRRPSHGKLTKNWHRAGIRNRSFSGRPGSPLEQVEVAPAETVVRPLLVQHHVQALEHGLPPGVRRPAQAGRHWRGR
jgi:hypothetical protein